MQRNSFVKMTKLPDVKGRIYYISSPARQENLYAVYETIDRDFWTKLGKCNQEEFAKSGAEGKCIEARELIIALPESFVDYEPKALLKLFTEQFKHNYGTECIAALHHNKRKTNYHVHLIFSERKLLHEPATKVATRNMFYDEAGKHVRTKKEILGEDGQIKTGCKIVPKGEVYEQMLFTIKEARYKSEGFLDEVKRLYTDLINLYIKDEKEQLRVFDRNSVYLPMKKIGKNNPKAEQIIADNQMRTKWNLTVDSALVSGISETQIMTVKRTQISQKANDAIRQNGNHPELFSLLIKLAVSTLEIFIRRILGMAYKQEEEVNALVTVVKAEPIRTVPYTKVEVTEPEAEKSALKRPKQTELASKYVKMVNVYIQLLKQSTAIDQRKQDIEGLEKELSGAKGVFKSKQRKMLQEQIDQAKTQLANMEHRLPAIVKQYHYRSVEEFIAEFKISKVEYEAYQKAVQMYENDIIKPEKESIKARLERHEWEIKDREAGKQHTSVKSKDKGAR